MTVPKRFDILRFFSALLKVLAWLNLVMAILTAIGVALAGAGLGSVLQSLGEQYSGATGWLGGLGGIIAAIVVLLAGLFYFVILYALGEFIALTIAVEENTRLSAALLLKMHQDNQAEVRTVYPGAFTNEPAPYK